MNTKFNSAAIQKAFADKFDEEKPNSEQLAQMLAFRFLSEVEIITDERKILRKDLAKSIGVSPSYITQLYQGNKPLNLETLAKIEAVLDIRFNVRAVSKEALESTNNVNNPNELNRTSIFLPTLKKSHSKAV